MGTADTQQLIVLRLPAEPIAPALARAGLRSAVGELPATVAADLALLTTEVVSNAVRHGAPTPGDEVVVRVAASDHIRVQVEAPGPPFDPGRPERPDDVRVHGWGLYLLDSLSRDWGVQTDGAARTTVWFELDRHP